ncbi:AraC family ligand binding domain-containing protein [Streptomyces sp. NPDC093510]|uniref:AraC family ligand binding domain-containing protein n=1 Tax=Streptomyces sp. NPDC093510 TaxID=3155199 RepID=UPI0034394095
MTEPAPTGPLFVDPPHPTAEKPGQISVVWTLGGAGRDLDAVVVRLAPAADLGEPTENTYGILLTVLAGSGTLHLPHAVRELAPGALAWLPAHTPHSLRAGQRGLTYTTAHRRPGPETAAGEPACLLERVCPRCGHLAATREAHYCAHCGTPLTGP